MHGLTFLQDLAVVMIAAGLVTVLFHRFKQPVVLGYIIAGVIIGPHTPPYALIHDEKTISTLSELGVILLMFSLGLEFSLRKLKKVGGAAFIAAFLEIILMGWIGYELGSLFGWRTMDSIFLGAMLSISSTAIIIKVLGDLDKIRERFAQLIFGILIIEDILGIGMIAVLSGIGTSGGLNLHYAGVTLSRLAIFLVAILVAGLLTVPRLVGYVARFKSNEMLLVTVLGLCFGVSLLAAKMGYSVALGAFVIGAVIAEAREIHRIESLTEPIRDMFSAVFFVSIGLLIEPALLIRYAFPIIIITLAVVVGKVLACSFGAFVAGNDTRTSLRVGMGLAQIGEFSFIIASLGLTLNVTSKFLYPIGVAVASITTLLTPYLIKSADGFVNWFDRVAPQSWVNSLETYTRWVGQLGSERKSSLAAKLVRRWVGQIALNAALVAAVFIAAAWFARRPPEWVIKLNLGGEMLKAAHWLAAATVSLPLFIAMLRKLQALGMLIAELRVNRENAGERVGAIRAVIARSILFAGILVLILYVLVLSSAILPSIEVLMALTGIVVLTAVLLWRSFVKLYSRAQVALQETLSQPPPVRPNPNQRALPGLLSEADLETLTVVSGTIAANKLILELELRSRTGASIVGIERAGGARVINPGPDEELQPGDQILLLGTRAQLDLAKAALAQPATQ